MGVVHILKDGSVVKDITGRVVRVEDAGPLYRLIDNMNRRGSRRESTQKKLREVTVC